MVAKANKPGSTPSLVAATEQSIDALLTAANTRSERQLALDRGEAAACVALEHPTFTDRVRQVFEDLMLPWGDRFIDPSTCELIEPHKEPDWTP